MNPSDSISENKKNNVYSLVRQYSKSSILLSKANIFSLLTRKGTLFELEAALHELQNDNVLSCCEGGLYFASESREYFQNGNFVPSSVKLEKVKATLNFLAKISTIRFIGITGSSTFEMVENKDDVDIFVIVQKHTLFITRLTIFVVTFIFGNFRTRKSKKTKDTVCTNVILEEENLKVPYPKRNLFSARELTQILSFYDKERMLDKLKDANSEWFYDLLPNQEHKSKHSLYQEKNSRGEIFLPWINSILAFFQLWYMKSKVTNELISLKQLWLHPNTRHKFN